MTGKLELFRDEAGGFRFRLQAGVGLTIASSKGYPTKAAALNGMKVMMFTARGATIDDQT